MDCLLIVATTVFLNGNIIQEYKTENPVDYSICRVASKMDGVKPAGNYLKHIVTECSCKIIAEKHKIRMVLDFEGQSTCDVETQTCTARRDS